MKRLSICLLALGLLAGSAHAVTRENAPGTQAQVPRQGTVNSRGAIDSAGKTYPVSGQTQVFDRKGAPLAAPRLAPGSKIAFTVTTDNVPKVSQIWIID